MGKKSDGSAQTTIWHLVPFSSYFFWFYLFKVATHVLIYRFLWLNNFCFHFTYANCGYTGSSQLNTIEYDDVRFVFYSSL